MILWITGFSGAGKSTIAKALIHSLKKNTPAVVYVDGDAVRKIIQDPATGHDRTSRLANAYRIARLAHHLESQGLLVVVATMSLFHEIHDWNRQHCNRYVEVLVKADMATLHHRDQKGLYSGYQAGTAQQVMGLDLSAELPKTPDIILDNSGTPSVESHVQAILKHIGDLEIAATIS